MFDLDLAVLRYGDVYACAQLRRAMSARNRNIQSRNNIKTMHGKTKRMFQTDGTDSVF
jgi:hypothetical protein